MKKLRLLAAFFAASASAAFLPFLVACAPSLTFARQCNVDFGWAPFALLITVPATLFVAVPLFLVFRKLGWVKWWQVCLGGALVGFLSPLAIQLMDAPSHGFWISLTVLSVPLGAVAGFVFWCIGVYKNV